MSIWEWYLAMLPLDVVLFYIWIRAYLDRRNSRRNSR